MPMAIAQMANRFKTGPPLRPVFKSIKMRPVFINKKPHLCLKDGILYSSHEDLSFWFGAFQTNCAIFIKAASLKSISLHKIWGRDVISDYRGLFSH